MAQRRHYKQDETDCPFPDCTRGRCHGPDGESYSFPVSPLQLLHLVRYPLRTSSYNVGNRKLKGWLCTGDSSIKEYFIRLTPDRQSKQGYCWNDAALNSNKWVTTIKFRISGAVSVSSRV